jgi:hypothetical protein
MPGWSNATVVIALAGVDCEHEVFEEIRLA